MLKTLDHPKAVKRGLMANLTRSERREKWKWRTPDERVAFSFGNSVRWRIVAALHGGEKSGAELARDVGLSRQAASYHIRELEASGAIELACSAENAEQRIYRAVETVAYTDEEFAELTPEQRLAHARLILTSFFAEAFSSWQADMMDADPYLYLVWDWTVSLDAQGCEEWKAEDDRHAEEQNQIRTRVLERTQKSGESPRRRVTGIFSFDRDIRLWGRPPQGA